MRTDSTRLSDTFVSAAQDYIGEKYGKEYIGKVKVGKEKRKCSRRSRRDSSYECIKNAGKCKRIFKARRVKIVFINLRSSNGFIDGSSKI